MTSSFEVIQYQYFDDSLSPTLAPRGRGIGGRSRSVNASRNRTRHTSSGSRARRNKETLPAIVVTDTEELKRELFSWKNIDTGKYECPYCTRMQPTNRLSNAQDHLKTHGPKNAVAFLCHRCGGTFATLGTHNRHTEACSSQLVVPEPKNCIHPPSPVSSPSRPVQLTHGTVQSPHSQNYLRTTLLGNERGATAHIHKSPPSRSNARTISTGIPSFTSNQRLTPLSVLPGYFDAESEPFLSTSPSPSTNEFPHDPAQSPQVPIVLLSPPPHAIFSPSSPNYSALSLWSPSMEPHSPSSLYNLSPFSFDGDNLPVDDYGVVCDALPGHFEVPLPLNREPMSTLHSQLSMLDLNVGQLLEFPEELVQPVLDPGDQRVDDICNGTGQEALVLRNFDTADISQAAGVERWDSSQDDGIGYTCRVEDGGDFSYEHNITRSGNTSLSDQGYQTTDSQSSFGSPLTPPQVAAQTDGHLDSVYAQPFIQDSVEGSIPVYPSSANSGGVDPCAYAEVYAKFVSGFNCTGNTGDRRGPNISSWPGNDTIATRLRPPYLHSINFSPGTITGTSPS